jgi:hypothetical protein
MLEWFYLASILISAAAAFIYRRFLKIVFLWPLVPFLLLLFVQEFVLMYMIPKGTSTGPFYNIYMPISATFYSWLFYSVPVNEKTKKFILTIWAIFICTVIIVHSYQNFSKNYNLYLFLAGGFVIATCAVIFLLNYFTIENRQEQRKWLPYVWICMGIVVFYPMVNITFALHKEILANHIMLFGKKLYQTMPQLMSIFLYGCFTYSFYLCKQINRN